MKNEIRGFIFLMAAVICFCTHQICDKLFWIAAYVGTVYPTSGSVKYGGVALFIFAVVFFVTAVYFFAKAMKEEKGKQKP